MFLEDNDSLDPFQSGFRSHHGTETLLVTLLDHLLWETDWGSMTLLVALDLSAAFDTVNHSILLDRLLSLGIRGLASRTFASQMLQDQRGARVTVALGQSTLRAQKFSQMECYSVPSSMADAREFSMGKLFRPCGHYSVVLHRGQSSHPCCLTST